MNELEFRASILFFLAALPFQHLQLDRLEPKEAELCAGRIGAIGFRGHLTMMEGHTCRFAVWQFKQCPDHELDTGLRAGWVMRGAGRPDWFESRVGLSEFQGALESFLENLAGKALSAKSEVLKA